ncbi:hypothetical protein F4679DRAFT_538025 [Xylaria curta]|nr:hypothetical protein F4679DRAFT_538025 [Xylaria curta]
MKIQVEVLAQCFWPSYPTRFIMCYQYNSTYPCGHTKTRWELCKPAKAANMLRRKDRPCDKIVKKDESPNLEETCGSTCLSTPYKCNKCGSPKQLMWRCSNCKALRNNSVQVYRPCPCPSHLCGESVIDTPLCKKCLDGCTLELNVSRVRFNST